MAKKSEILIRRATPNDVFDIIALLGELFDIEKDFAFDFNRHKQGLHLLLENPNVAIFVADDKGKAVGVITIQEIISSAMGTFVGLVEDVVVKKEYKNLGIATRLVDAVISYARNKEYSRIHLLCDDDNPPAQEFYKKFGFKQSSLNAWYYFL